MDLKQLSVDLKRLESDLGENDWPVEGMQILQQAGCFRAVVPQEYGGDAVAPEVQLNIYEEVACGSVALALILTQHDGACELIAGGENKPLCERVLPGVVSGATVLTVGISQLTTSRQAGGRPLKARRADIGYELNGRMPWVTNAVKASYIVTGALVEDGLQILACIPTSTPGLIIEKPMQLMGLSHSWTGSVECDRVRITDDDLVRGPAEKVLALRSPAKPLAVSAVGLGLARALLERIEEYGPVLGGDFDNIHREANSSWLAVRDRVYAAADALRDPAAEIPASDIRVEVNALLMRLAPTCLVLAKGTGYRADHPVQQLVREAMFFLVWSAPAQVQLGTLGSIWNQTSDPQGG